MSLRDLASTHRGCANRLDRTGTSKSGQVNFAENQSGLTRLFEALNEHIRAMVHPSAQGEPASLLQHKIFIASRLLMSLAALLLMPAFLAAQQFALQWQIAALSWASLPILAVFWVSRTGRLISAQMICALCLALLAVVFAQSGRTGAALTVLLLVPIEIAFSADLIAILGAALFTGVCAALILIAQKHGVFAAAVTAKPIVTAAVLVPGVIYTISLGYLFYAMLQISHRATTEGATRFESLSEAVGDLVMRHAANGAVVSSSEASLTLFDIDASELAGRGFFDRLNVADRPAFLKTMAQALETDQTICTHLRLRTGRMTTVEAKDYPTRLRGEFDSSRNESTPVYADVELRARRMVQFKSDGVTQACSIMSIVRDMSAERRHEAELEAARANAEQLNVWKDRLIANVSHELRTPLNAIIGFAEMLSDEHLAPKTHVKRSEYAGIIASSGHHLLEVVNAILDMSKIEAGQFHLAPEPFEIIGLLDTCASLFSLKAQEAKVHLVRDFGNVASGEIVGDKRACKQIIINLLSNALKFTPTNGRVTLSVRPLGNSVCIRVRDSGIGMSAADLARIGQPFFQATANYDRAFEGTGLGLSVVRGFVGLHGGDMRIESEPDRGTIVTVRLPLDCRYSDNVACAPPSILIGELPVSDVIDATTFQSARMKKSA